VTDHVYRDRTIESALAIEDADVLEVKQRRYRGVGPVVGAGPHTLKNQSTTNIDRVSDASPVLQTVSRRYFPSVCNSPVAPRPPLRLVSSDVINSFEVSLKSIDMKRGTLKDKSNFIHGPSNLITRIGLHPSAVSFVHCGNSPDFEFGLHAKLSLFGFGSLSIIRLRPLSE